MLKLFKITAILEGISSILLFFFAMPMKYIWEEPIFVKPLGMAHGILFIGYIILALIFRSKFNWNLKTLAVVLGASLIPFATFYIEKKYLRNA